MDVTAVVRDGPRTIVATEPSEVVMLDGPAALDWLDGLTDGWWAGWLTYDLGRAVERVVPRTADDLGLPGLAMARFERREVLPPGARPFGRPAPVALGPWRSSLERPDYESAVEAVLELLAAGECYQVNLTRRLTAEGDADPAALFASLAERNPAPHAAFVRLPGAAVVSASPELFLRRDGDLVETRPIKGTGTDPVALRASAKDQAENVMIVDLARNDLGRVCRYGSLAVPGLFEVEEHPGLHHLVSTVTARLRPGTTTGALVRATFPPASVTGAPKPRVMQAIEDLEPVRRGVYCGAVGWVDAGADRLEMNVAIRTFTVLPGRTLLGVGGGIVADSRPDREWEETELKAARLLEAAGALRSPLWGTARAPAGAAR